MISSLFSFFGLPQKHSGQTGEGKKRVGVWWPFTQGGGWASLALGYYLIVLTGRQSGSL
jgi:hypothetical protein